VVEFLEPARIARLGTDALAGIFDRHLGLKRGRSEHRGSIFQVTLNRPAELALADSVPAIKADAARSLFSISCAELGWAVVDSGIDHRHPAFRDQKHAHRLIKETKNPAADPDQAPYKSQMKHRIRGAFDFTRIRAILGAKAAEIAELAAEISVKTGMDLANCTKQLEAIIADREAREPIDWRKIQPLIELKLDDAAAPQVAHGTHVAGIIGADWQVRNKVTGNFEPRMTGVCPDIRLYDLRVLGSTLGDSEFAVSCALQFIRYFNQQLGYQRIHGVNLSLAIHHNVANYACGQTPVCKQAEALVANGVVVVAAAGNRGYLKYQLADQSVYEGYAASSITDPGNADGVITVGATHRSFPHTYGVSFFSSRGPTGDGRLKPDLLAPGEKIVSCVGKDRQDAMDGTSMAAPHVSGAAALLMARHEELKGNPVRIKQVLCSTATDLKRERQFQGHGMIDVLRAIQSI
jgi:subtilisin family serine protease